MRLEGGVGGLRVKGLGSRGSIQLPVKCLLKVYIMRFAGLDLRTGQGLQTF